MFISVTQIPGISISIPSLSWLHSSLLAHRPRFNSMPVHTGFVVEKVTFGQVFFQVLQVLPFTIIPNCTILKYHSTYLSYQLTVSFKILVSVLGRSFHVHITVHNLNKPINVTKNKNLCTYSLAKEDDNNLIRKSTT